MYTKKITYLLIVLSSLMFLGCGGSSGNTDDNTISNTAPVANAGNDLSVPLGQTITIAGIGTDNDGTIVSYIWSDGTTQLASTESFDYTPDTEGTDTLTLTVTDNDGANASDSMDVTVTTVDSNLTLNDFEDVVPHNPSFSSLHFSGSQNCAQCHDGISDTSNGKDVSIVKAWQGTMMANAAIDPLYLAKVASEVQRNPDFKEDIEAKCSRCHMPMAHVEAEFSGITPTMFGEDSFIDSNNIDYYHAAKDGVSCTLCHQIEDTPELGTEAGFSGEFVIDDKTLIYGPYDSVKQAGRMENRVGFTPTYSPHVTDSKLCASCHNLNTPVIDVKTNDYNGLTFPEQAVYSEWEYSEFNATQSCQECHMPRTEGSVVIATGGGGGAQSLSPRAPFLQHKFLGANTYMLEIIKNNRTKLGALADEARFNVSITDTKAFLLQATAEINIATKSFSNGTLKFSVLVTNKSGHKFPTSIPTRRAWLHVKVTDDNNQTVFESGDINEKGQIIGVDDTEGYEYHHNTIDNNGSVQVYEAIMADTDGNPTYTFMNASEYLKDNRILPKGFNKNNAPDNIKPYGEAVDDNDFVGGSDTVAYEVDNLAEYDDYTISVTLKYQTASYGFMQDLYKNVNLTEVALMKVLDDNTNNHFEIISTDTVSIAP